MAPLRSAWRPGAVRRPLLAPSNGVGIAEEAFPRAGEGGIRPGLEFGSHGGQVIRREDIVAVHEEQERRGAAVEAGHAAGVHADVLREGHDLKSSISEGSGHGEAVFGAGVVHIEDLIGCDGLGEDGRKTFPEEGGSVGADDDHGDRDAGAEREWGASLEAF
ncbi:MAG TPA: hypothetical protein P5016_15000 [Verrucomicrobiales bacterium]|nr:hypothetical protein [Verrucomicrobiales bacterium]